MAFCLRACSGYVFTPQCAHGTPREDGGWGPGGNALQRSALLKGTHYQLREFVGFRAIFERISTC